MANSKSSALFKKYLSRINSLTKEEYASKVFSSLARGQNSYMRLDRLESSSFDMDWINAIERCIQDISDIIANPREVTKTVSNIVPIELAKKTTSESVRHLASHTHLIKEVNDKGDVVPNKILNIGNEVDIHTYENRFIATLIRMLLLFIEKRYEFVKKIAELHDEEILYFKNKSMVDGAEVEIETKIKVKSKSDTKMADVSSRYVDRILKIREYILYFYSSPFMKEMKTDKNVRNPIIMTNILRKNPKYRRCYELYSFIEKYDKLGVTYKVDEDASIFNEQELNEINAVMFANYLALKAKDKSLKTKGFSRTYKPKILTSIDDEEFIYGDLLNGPIEFLRIDEGYRQYLEKQNKQELPLHPTKIEKEYYKDEYEAKNKLKEDKAALDKLEKRKKKEQLEFDRRAKLIIAKREQEERERIAREQELARLEEEKRIEIYRKELVKNAKDDNKHHESVMELIKEKELENEEIKLEEQDINNDIPLSDMANEVIQGDESIDQIKKELEEEKEDVPNPLEEPIKEQDVFDINNDELENKKIINEEIEESNESSLVEDSNLEEQKEETPVIESVPSNEENKEKEQNEVEPVSSNEEPVKEEIAPVDEVKEKSSIDVISPVSYIDSSALEVKENTNKPSKEPSKKEKKAKEEKVEREKIPGRYIVKTMEGYYVEEGKLSIYKDDAKIFLDFNLANDIKKRLGGKVVRIL